MSKNISKQEKAWRIVYQAKCKAERKRFENVMRKNAIIEKEKTAASP